MEYTKNLYLYVFQFSLNNLIIIKLRPIDAFLHTICDSNINNLKLVILLLKKTFLYQSQNALSMWKCNKWKPLQVSEYNTI